MNPKLCRYKEIFPYINNTVTISNDHKIINASWIHIPYEKSFIATQGPPEYCKEDFWQMCFEYNVKVIVMLCKEEEEGVKKCSTYWDLPKSAGFKILKIEEKEKNNLYIVKDIIVQRSNEQQIIRRFAHFQFLEWPDHRTPNYENVVKNFEYLFQFVKIKKEREPAVIHCSAGVGRTGVFLTLYILYKEIMDKINSNSEEISFNIFNLVRKLKEFRMFLVENINQYGFIYHFIDELLKEKNIPRQNQL